MQRLKKCLGIDIGGTSVKIAEIVSEKSGARITKMARADLGLAPGPMDTERINALAKAVRDLLKENKISTKHAVFCLPGQSVFIRKVKVPRTTEERLQRIVAYEARQQIPFALDNSLMEFQVFDQGDPQELEVLLVAIKKDLISDFMKVINKTALKPVMISVSSLALFNFHIYESTPFDELMEQLNPKKSKKAKSAEPQGEASVEAGAPAKKKGFSLQLPKLNFSFGKKKPAAPAAAAAAEGEEGSVGVMTEDALPDDYFEEVRAYVNIGAQMFDLAIGRLGKVRRFGFSRSVPWAGNELTRMLQDKLGLESSAEAEKIKRDRAIVVLPGREEELSDGTADADASEFTTSWADRLILDLRKSFDFYISQPDGMAVDTIYLSGGQSHQRNLATYVEEKLGIPVEVKAQSENEALKGADVGGEGGELTSYAIALGLGLTGVGYGHIDIDFLPPDLKTLREFKKKNLEIGLLVLAIGAMLGVSRQVGQQQMTQMNTWLDANRDKIMRAETLKKNMEEAKGNREKVNGAITALGQAISDRAFWLEFLGTLESIKPNDVLITSLQMTPWGEVDIDGETEVGNSVNTLVDKLKDASMKQWVKPDSVDLAVQPRFSSFINKEVYGFHLKLMTAWKETRLAPARVTFAPGLSAPTPTPASSVPMGGPAGGGGAKGAGAAGTIQ